MASLIFWAFGGGVAVCLLETHHMMRAYASYLCSATLGPMACTAGVQAASMRAGQWSRLYRGVQICTCERFSPLAESLKPKLYAHARKPSCTGIACHGSHLSGSTCCIC
jgi:hypothetical protein